MRGISVYRGKKSLLASAQRRAKRLNADPFVPSQGCCYYRTAHKYTPLQAVDLDLGELEGEFGMSPRGARFSIGDDADLEAFHDD